MIRGQMSQPTRAAATTRAPAAARPAAPTRSTTTARAAARSATKARPRSRHVPETDPYRRGYSKDRSQLVRRLSRMEGQVRGIARMIERDEYCVDILQQTAALRAAVDALSVLVLEDHVQDCVRTAAERGQVDEYVDEVIDVVRRTMGRPVRGARTA
jgi:CsoR family transcriptional regulator, copper-sensing transcriptional repressor